MNVMAKAEAVGPQREAPQKRSPTTKPCQPRVGRMRMPAATDQPHRIGPVSRLYFTPPRTSEPLTRMHCPVELNQVYNGPA